MMNFLGKIGLLLAFMLAVTPAGAADNKVPERVLGHADAPVTVEEFISLTCPHCAEFYTTVLPDLEKNYVETGKVKFILRDFPLDGTALKAASLARCMPEDEFYPFINVLYKNQKAWALGSDTDKVLVQYARLGGLGEDKAKECLKDAKLQDAIIAERTDASQKYGIEATPTFVINNGSDILKGAQSTETFGAIFDRLLAAKKQK